MQNIFGLYAAYRNELNPQPQLRVTPFCSVDKRMQSDKKLTIRVQNKKTTFSYLLRLFQIIMTGARIFTTVNAYS